MLSRLMCLLSSQLGKRGILPSHREFFFYFLSDQHVSRSHHQTTRARKLHGVLPKSKGYLGVRKLPITWYWQQIYMNMTGGALEAIRYERGNLKVLDQLRLPHEFVYDDVSTCELAFECIRAMRVRGTSERRSSVFLTADSE